MATVASGASALVAHPQLRVARKDQPGNAPQPPGQHDGNADVAAAQDDRVGRPGAEVAPHGNRRDAKTPQPRREPGQPHAHDPADTDREEIELHAAVQLAVELARPAHDGEVGLRVAQQLAQTARHGQGREDVSGGAAAGQHDSHSRRCKADFRATLSSMPIISSEARSDEPPRLTNGSVRPVTGINPVTTPMFTNA